MFYAGAVFCLVMLCTGKIAIFVAYGICAAKSKPTKILRFCYDRSYVTNGTAFSILDLILFTLVPQQCCFQPSQSRAVIKYLYNEKVQVWGFRHEVILVINQQNQIQNPRGFEI